MKYIVILPKSVRKQMDRLADFVEERIFQTLIRLESNPRPADCKKLKGRNAWRVRVGDYRISYEIYDRELKIIVIEIGHRREVYR